MFCQLLILIPELKINKEQFNKVYQDVIMKMEEYSKEISNLEKSLEIFDEKVRRDLSNLLLKLSNMYRDTKLEIENIAEKIWKSKPF